MNTKARHTLASILICYDGSDRAAHAIAVTAELFPGAQAHVLNVWEPMERIVARYSAIGPYIGGGIGEADTGIEADSNEMAKTGAIDLLYQFSMVCREEFERSRVEQLWAGEKIGDRG